MFQEQWSFMIGFLDAFAQQLGKVAVILFDGAYMGLACFCSSDDVVLFARLGLGESPGFWMNVSSFPANPARNAAQSKHLLWLAWTWTSFYG